MAFKKGTSGNPAGRPKGSRNKADKDLKTWIAEVLTNGQGKFEESLNSLTPGEYVKVFVSLLNYGLPKLQSMSPGETLDAEYRRLEELLQSAPDEAINEIMERINRMKNEERGKTTEDK